MTREYVYIIIKNGVIKRVAGTPHRAEIMKEKIKAETPDAIVKIEKRAVE